MPRQISEHALGLHPPPARIAAKGVDFRHDRKENAAIAIEKLEAVIGILEWRLRHFRRFPPAIEFEGAVLAKPADETDVVLSHKSPQIEPKRRFQFVLEIHRLHA